MQTTSSFFGFTPETVEFLQNLKENNFREWFEDHREVYEIELRHPFKALIQMLSPVMYNIDPAFEMRPHKVLSRIHRDIRFSKNKEPYKTCIWMSFQRSKTQWQNYPGFFMELNTKRVLYGMGMYQPQRKVIDTFRAGIEMEPERFEKIVKNTVDKNKFVINGETYKRLLKNTVCEYLQPWMQRKSVYVTKTIAIDNPIIYSKKLAQQLAKDFAVLQPLYSFMTEVLDEEINIQ